MTDSHSWDKTTLMFAISSTSCPRKALIVVQTSHRILPTSVLAKASVSDYGKPLPLQRAQPVKKTDHHQQLHVVHHIVKHHMLQIICLQEILEYTKKNWLHAKI